MIKIAICHYDVLQRKKYSQDFTNGLKELQIYGKVYSVQDLHRFSEGVLSGKYAFDIICIDTTEKLWARRLMERDHQNTEYILLDTPMQEVSGYMRYKPAGWLKSDEANREKIVETLQACIYHLHRNRDECFCLHTKAKTVRIPYRQILYLESRLRQVVVHTVREKDICAFAAVLDDVANVLPEESFFRCHQSFLVILRHSFATRLIEAGGEAKSLSLIIGHSDVSFTLKCYVHPDSAQLHNQMMLLSRVGKG